ncbi:PP2C family protein-serine/threonine phosphatase [Desmospora profundinema]|uniref:PAS domain S-box-containing protein n=1 Tax=Desmospora profundinema TaxID=1571184 RepID=A0ABU1IRF3_9BACL|nr:PAS domain-containing protein [Desmospora profundinema]MDR6227375.1 PAS domain S-box-containing protein [Desmospora profundinema]
MADIGMGRWEPGEEVSGLELLLEKQFAAAMDHLPAGVCITDPRLPDNPVIYVNPGFTKLTGYSAEEVVGKNCRFLQCENTDPAAVEKIRSALEKREPVKVVLLNRRKNGVPFWNELKVNPVWDEEGNLVHFVAMQTDVTVRVEAKRDLALAAKVQRTMLPVPMENEFLRLETLYRPYGFISGDSYDFHWNESEEKLFGYLFDVMGHGVATALQTSALRVLFEQVSKKRLSLSEKLSWVNDASLPYLADEYFIAAIAFELNFQQQVLSYAAGGVNYFLASTSGTPEIVSVPGMFLGIFEGTSFEQNDIPFQSGDSFSFFSDGLHELMPSPLEELPSDFDRMVDWLRERSQNPNQRDDISALCLHIK